MVVGSGSLEDGGFDIVVAPENRRHDNSQRCFAVGTRTRIKGLSWNGYGDEYNIYSTTTTKVKVIMKKCKKVMNGWKLKNQEMMLLKMQRVVGEWKKPTKTEN